jgi:hypothetical protein
MASADYMQGTRLSFRTKEDAIHFAEKQGQSEPSFVCRLGLTSTLKYRLGLFCVCLIHIHKTTPLTSQFTGLPRKKHISPQRTMQRTTYTSLTNFVSVVPNRLFNHFCSRIWVSLNIQNVPFLYLPIIETGTTVHAWFLTMCGYRMRCE